MIEEYNQKNTSMTQKFFHIMLWEINYQAFELFNGIIVLMLGLTFLIFPDQEPINYMVWTISPAMILFGALKLFAIGRRNIRIRKWLALISAFLWGFLFAYFNHYPIRPTSIIFISILILFSMWTYIRVVLEHRGARLLDPRDPYTNP